MKRIILILLFCCLPITLEAALIDNLISYWKLDEGSGNAVDSHGDNNGSVNGATQGADGKINDAYNFDGNNDYVDCGIGVAIDGLSAFSISLWLKWNATGDYDVIIGKYKDSNGNTGMNFDSSPGTTLTANVCNGTLSYGYIDNFVGDTGVWYHVVIVFDGSGENNADKLKVYKNGEAQTLNFNGTIPATTADLSSYNFYFGYPSDTYCFNGIMDEVGLWNRALTPSEVSELYNGGDGLAYPFTAAAVLQPISGFID